LPAAFAAIGLALVTYRLGRDFIGARAGFLGAVILATTTRAIWEGRWAHTDMPLSFFLACSLYFLLRVWAGEGGKREALVGYFFMGLAVLTKGLIGVVLPGLVFFVLVLVTREFRRLRDFYIGRGLVVFILTVAPWFIAVSAKTDGLWLEEFIWVHHIRRYVAGGGHEEPFYYYFLNFPPDFLPWALFLIPAFAAVRWKRAVLMQPVPLAFTVWFVGVFVFFTLSDSKRGLYLLPLYPPAALFIADYLVNRERGEKSLKAMVYVLVASLVIGAAGLPIVALKLRPELLAVSLLIAATMAGGGWWIARSFRTGDAIEGSCRIGLVMLAFVLWAGFGVFPVVDKEKSPRGLAVKLENIISPADPLYIYADRMNDFNFYLRRERIPVLSGPDELARLKSNGRVFVLIRDRDAARVWKDRDPDWEPVLEEEVGSKKWIVFVSRKKAAPSQDTAPAL
jgi:4-amino-4-deoxy-L-arabinose transferase-like glycosyltransferase